MANSFASFIIYTHIPNYGLSHPQIEGFQARLIAWIYSCCFSSFYFKDSIIRSEFLHCFTLLYILIKFK